MSGVRPRGPDAGSPGGHRADAGSAGTDFGLVDSLIARNLRPQLAELVGIQTWRGGDRTEEQVAASVEEVRDRIAGWADAYAREHLERVSIVPLSWKSDVQKPGTGGTYQVFGLRIGSGTKRRVSVICHLDTVPPGSAAGWNPFVLKEERRAYVRGTDEAFYVGRGAIDDKGPAVVALNALLAAATWFDQRPGNPLADTTIELLLDTSEETDMSFPHYLEANPGLRPTLGVVFDAMWSVRAEKGIERPVFSLPLPAVAAPPTDGRLRLQRLSTSDGSSNQIADAATAVIGGDAKSLHALAQVVASLYGDCPFDDPHYRRAGLTVDGSRIDGNGELSLTTVVAGAQHGSAPEENRAGGANPLVSLANFMAYLVEEGRIVENERARMARFIAWAWGTKVFGEHHRDLLYRFDGVFVEGNGTTYAVTKISESGGADGPPAVVLEIDVRYAIPHNAPQWDGESEGLLGGSSIFGVSGDPRRPAVFPALLRRFEDWAAAHPAPQRAAAAIPAIRLVTSTADTPDIRIPDRNAAYLAVARAFERVTGSPPAPLAIGGGSDAKGQLELVAAGALFTRSLGPPINFHGIDEGAPVEDLKSDARVLYQLFLDQAGP